ncbi:AraC family transcriptional regulator [Alicyclobacillus fodiniaquatilis]|uniref:AraC family transcriptional regulator n=1 Tax=Alicyclobacillus fodiniaquatilis TaxID=1661150 RepID=A0ABW4JE85_9BACL
MYRLEGKDYFNNELLFHAESYYFQDSGIEAHCHDFVELVYVVSGRGEHVYKGHSYTITAGDVFVIEPEVEHMYRVDGAGSLTVYNILFQPSVFKEELITLSKVTSFLDFFYVEPFLREVLNFQSHLKLNIEERMEMKLLLDKLLEEYERQQLGYQILIKTRLIEVFIFLSRCYQHKQEEPTMASITDEQAMLNHVRDFIQVHYASPLTLEQVSHLCGLSQSAFTDKFKRHVGKTFIQFRNDIRLSFAREFIAKTEEPITEIALRVGFGDISYFNKTFKRALGLTPSEYRRQVNVNASD